MRYFGANDQFKVYSKEPNGYFSNKRWAQNVQKTHDVQDSGGTKNKALYTWLDFIIICPAEYNFAVIVGLMIFEQHTKYNIMSVAWRQTNFVAEKYYTLSSLRVCSVLLYFILNERDCAREKGNKYKNTVLRNLKKNRYYLYNAWWLIHFFS